MVKTFYAPALALGIATVRVAPTAITMIIAMITLMVMVPLMDMIALMYITLMRNWHSADVLLKRMN